MSEPTTFREMIEEMRAAIAGISDPEMRDEPMRLFQQFVADFPEDRLDERLPPISLEARRRSLRGEPWVRP